MKTQSWARILIVLIGLTLAFASGSAGDDDGDDIEFQVKGSGIYLLTTSGGSQIEVDFAFHARQEDEDDDSDDSDDSDDDSDDSDDDDGARGRFRQALEFQGLPIEFHGEVTCLSVDPANGRVWVGGIVTQNLSVHPGFVGKIHQPGKDVWFRILDTGKGAAEPDRSTFLGFEGSADIITSEEYCELQPWPNDNARTHPVIKGRIKLKIDDD